MIENEFFFLNLPSSLMVDFLNCMLSVDKLHTLIIVLILGHIPLTKHRLICLIYTIIVSFYG